MRIGFDAKRLFNNSTGLGNYSRTLVRSISELYPENDLFLFTPAKGKNIEAEYFYSSNFSIISPHKAPGWLWRSFLMTKDIKKLNLDIYHGLSHELPYGIHTSGTKTVVTIHDLIYKFHPEDFPYFDRLVYERKFKYACQYADVIIAISQSTKNDIVKYYGVSESKIQVVYQTCNPDFQNVLSDAQIDSVLKQYKLPDDFLLYVGTINRRKNLLSVVKAINAIKKDLKTPLLVVGNGKEYKQEIEEYIKLQNLEKLIYFAPYIRNDHLPALYQNAKAFIYPSKYEGFGIPIIESLYSKTPVITTRMSSLPEAAGPGAIYVEPEKIEEISEAILSILKDDSLRNELSQNGFEYVQKFNQKILTTQIFDIYKSL